MESIQTKATNIITALQKQFTNNRFHLDILVKQYVKDKETLREITRQLTGETKPLSQCNSTNIINLLMAHFQQYSLF